MLKRILTAALLLVAAGAQAREVPVGDFFKDAEFTDVTLSPSGKYLAVTVPEGDRTRLAVLNSAK